MMKQVTRWFLMVGCVIVLAAVVGCAQAPTADIDAARSAVGQARDAEAATYASGDLAKAEDSLRQLEAEVALQSEKFSVFRSYDRTQELVTEVTSAAQTASSTAAAGKETARTEAADSIAEAKALFQEVQGMLTTAPAGKGSQTDLAALKADLAGVEMALAEVDGAFQSGRYLDAKTGAASARDSVQEVKAAIEQAIVMRQQSVRQRRG